jgi:hypothetical protein
MTTTEIKTLVQIPAKGTIIGLVAKSDCQCCGKTHIDTILIKDGETTIRMGTHCVSSHFVFEHQKPIQPSRVKKLASHADYLIRTCTDTPRTLKVQRPFGR